MVCNVLLCREQNKDVFRIEDFRNVKLNIRKFSLFLKDGKNLPEDGKSS
jgi:hypothetical protein